MFYWFHIWIISNYPILTKLISYSKIAVRRWSILPKESTWFVQRSPNQHVQPVVGATSGKLASARIIPGGRMDWSTLSIARIGGARIAVVLRQIFSQHGTIELADHWYSSIFLTWLALYASRVSLTSYAVSWSNVITAYSSLDKPSFRFSKVLKWGTNWLFSYDVITCGWI